MDAKIAVASLAAVVFLSAIFLSGTGLGTTFNDLIQRFSDMARNSPIEGFFVSQNGQGVPVSVSLYPSQFAFKPGKKVNITGSDEQINGFGGQIILDYQRGSMELSDNQLDIRLPLKTYNIDNLVVSSIDISSLKFAVSGQVSSGNGSISIKNFAGTAIIDKDKVTLTGNVTGLTASVNGQQWQLK